MIPREPEETNPEKPEVKEESAPEPEQDLAKALSDTKQKAEDYLDSWKRAQADFINYKRRTEQERLEIGKYANTQLILSLLPILDDFERAFESITTRDWRKQTGWMASDWLNVNSRQHLKRRDYPQSKQSVRHLTLTCTKR